MKRSDDQRMWNPRFPNKYDFVCSIGHYCGTASYLRRHHLRRASGPLDWNGENPSGLQGTVDTICSDFKDFIRIEALTKLEHPVGERLAVRLAAFRCRRRARKQRKEAKNHEA